MRQKRMRGSGWKFLSVLLAHGAAAVVAACAILLTMLFSYDVQLGEKPDKDFVQTRNFAEQRQYEAWEIMSAVSAQRLLEEGAQLGALVDVREMAEDKELTWENTSGLAYRFEDLQNWCADGMSYRWNDELGTDVLEELYPPVGFQNIKEAVEASEGWTLEGAYNSLEEAVSKLGYLENQMQLLENYRKEESNLRYLYVDLDEKEVYTNEEDIRYSDYEKALKEVKKQDAYLILGSEDTSCETNMDVDETLWQEHADMYRMSDRYVYAVWMDGKFAVPDSLALDYQIYERFSDKTMEILWIGIGGLVLFLVCVIHLTRVAGRRPKQEALYLNAFDHVFVEVAAGGVLLLWILGISSVDSFQYYRAWDLISTIAAIEFIAACSVSCFLILWLTLVRRIKAGVLWKSSFLCFLCLWTRKIFGMLRRGFSNFMDSIHGRDPVLLGMKKITDGQLQYKIPTERLSGKKKTMAEYVNRIGDGLDAAVEQSVKNERMKTELITNVSHDIKTPLTSIINYVDLLKRENIPDEKIQGYIRVLDEKAQRLKVLTEDVVEASKASTGNITLEMTDLDFRELFHQVLGEFGEKFEEKELTLMLHEPEEPVVIHADGRRMWRVLENVFGNAVKYSMPGTRVYAEVSVVNKRMLFSLKNVSAQPLNISADELTERFIRGDVSRNTEGSGLGLSIAKSLTELQGGVFKLYLDGDLFKVTVIFTTVK